MIDLNTKSALLVTKPEHIFYLTNFDGEGFVIVTKKETILVTDQRYWLLAKSVRKSGVKLLDRKAGWAEVLNKSLGKINEIYFEEDHLTISGLERWKNILKKKKWSKNKGMINQLRYFKSEDELDNLRMAAKLGDKVLSIAKKLLKPGVKEITVANAIRSYANDLADGISFDPIVAFGENSASPHHHSGEKKLKKNDVILIDQGVKYAGYMSDMTRCFFIGSGIPKIVEKYKLLLDVQKAGVQMVRPGVIISDLSTASRAMLGKDKKYFTHSLGHGVGLEIHEAPGVSTRSSDVLEEDMVITIEPGLYYPKLGGLRIEDTVIVKDGDCEVNHQES